MTSQHQISN